jgi:hypothetical protein
MNKPSAAALGRSPSARSLLLDCHCEGVIPNQSIRRLLGLLCCSRNDALVVTLKHPKINCYRSFTLEFYSSLPIT